ncbi:MULTISPECIES: hypothetical protein [unclassified Mesorhizobium]
MRTGKSARIVVVGGGVTGLSTAWWLQVADLFTMLPDLQRAL